MFYIILFDLLLIQHLKQQERSEKPVNYDYFLFVLEDGVDTVSTLVVPEEDSITDLEVKRKKWKSDKKVVIKKWEVRSAVTEVNKMVLQILIIITGNCFIY